MYALTLKRETSPNFSSFFLSFFYLSSHSFYLFIYSCSSSLSLSSKLYINKMDDDTIEYFFDNIESFYAGKERYSSMVSIVTKSVLNRVCCFLELDDVLNRPYSTEQDVQRITTQYIRFLTRYQRKKEKRA